MFSIRKNTKNYFNPMKVINLIGGPGTGKSVTAASLFARMKREGINCEYVTEFAKDLVWGERFPEMKDQIYIFGKGYHKLWKLDGKVDYAILDSPLILSLYFGQNKTELFKQFVLETFNSFNNYNFVLTRNFKYQVEGRVETEEQADFAHDSIIKLLDDNNIKYYTVPNSDEFSREDWIENVLKNN